MEIVYFKINGRETEEYKAATGEKLTLSWKCNDCGACIIYPYNREEGPEGSIEVCVYQTMFFLLRACSKSGSIQKEIHVIIKGREKLNSVTVLPEGPVQAGEETTFKFAAQNTNYGYLDHGIGRVEGDSCKQILRGNYSVYRYSILSQDTAKITFQEETAKAGGSNALALDRLKYVLMQDGSRQTYQADWRIVNHCGADVLIKVSDNQTSFDNSASGHVVFTREGGDIRTLSIQCRTDTGEELHFSSIYPFEIKQGGSL